jgi:hypothetical protein
MRDADWWLHLAGGMILSFATLWLTHSLIASFLWPTLLGYSRETEQFRLDARIMRVRPGDPRNWSPHRLSEFIAWPIGAACVCVPAFWF